MADDGTIAKGSADAIATVRGFRATFEEVVQRAVGTGAAVSQPFVDGVRKSFDGIEKELETANDTAREILVDSGEELARLRAYVIPRQEILVEGRLRLADMSDWSVPGNVTDRLALETVPLLSSNDENVARAALRTLYENYDFWDWYTDIHATTMRIAAGVLLGLLLLSLTGAVMLLHFTHVYSGLFCAGAAGAFLSVVAKLPPVMNYGESNAYFHRILSRVGVGIAASMIGAGLLAADVVSIHIPDSKYSISDIIDGKDTVQIHPPDGTDDGQRFPHSIVLLLTSLAMLFGFSERALSTFEDKVIPGRVAIATPPDNPNPPATDKDKQKAKPPPG